MVYSKDEFERVHGIPSAAEYETTKATRKGDAVGFLQDTQQLDPMLRQSVPAATTRPLTMPTDAAARKKIPICTGVLDYFPDALLAVAEVSYAGNEQHNPGQPLHWDRSKSTDQADTAVRHIMERGKIDTDGKRHLAKAAWRILAALQLEIEEDLKKG